MLRFILPVIGLFCASGLFAQDPGDAFFSEWTVHEIRFQFSQPGYFDSLKMNYTLDAYMRCEVSVDGTSYPMSGVKYKGNSSFNNQSKKKPFRIDFEEYGMDQQVDGLKKLVLNNAFKDPTLLREKLMLDFLNAHNLAAPRATFAKLYINDHYWGLYSVVEDVNKTFLKDRFDNKSGNLFKGDPKGLLTWKNTFDQPAYTGDYELKTNETENNWTDLIRFINALNNTPAPQLKDSLDRYLNLQSWYGYWAAHNLFANLDSYLGSGHNYFIYHNADTDKFEWISWDVNEAFGNFQMGISLANIKVLPYSFIPAPATQRPMMNKVWTDPVMKQQYADQLCALLTDFTNAKMDPHIDSLANLIRPFVYADTLKFFTNAQFDQNLNMDMTQPVPGASGIAGLKPFITARRNSLLQQLAAVGCSATNTEYPTTSVLSVFPNPAYDKVTVTAGSDLLRSVAVFGADGRLVLSQVVDNEPSVLIDTANLPFGSYIIRALTDSGPWQGVMVVGR